MRTAGGTFVAGIACGWWISWWRAISFVGQVVTLGLGMALHCRRFYRCTCTFWWIMVVAGRVRDQEVSWAWPGREAPPKVCLTWPSASLPLVVWILFFNYLVSFICVTYCDWRSVWRGIATSKLYQICLPCIFLHIYICIYIYIYIYIWTTPSPSHHRYHTVTSENITTLPHKNHHNYYNHNHTHALISHNHHHHRLKPRQPNKLHWHNHVQPGFIPSTTTINTIYPREETWLPPKFQSLHFFYHLKSLHHHHHHRTSKLHHCQHNTSTITTLYTLLHMINRHLHLNGKYRHNSTQPRTPSPLEASALTSRSSGFC